MAKPFYVIALFVTMVTSLVALWNINLSSWKVALYLSRHSPCVHQEASWGAALIFCNKESGLISVEDSPGLAWTLLRNCWVLAHFLPLGFSQVSKAPTGSPTWEKAGKVGCRASTVVL